MFKDMAIVTTAVSSFNNAALYSPYFVVAALFGLPLFFMLFIYGQDFISKIGWSHRDVESKTGFISVCSLFVWLLIFGGNYAVIRDGISLLPIMIAIVLFGSTIFITQHIKEANYLSKIHDKKLKWFVFLLIFILAGFAAMPTWWGILLQLSAVLCGMIVGDRLKIKVSDFVSTTLIFGMMIALILMQPEFFRFGQLGNLTLIHIIALLTGGFFAITTLVTKYTNARSKIYNSAYIKLKWLFRIMALLALVLFAVTESVPVFIGFLVVCAALEMLTIYHGKNKTENISKQSWALMLIVFGVMIICPVISALGIIYLLSLPDRIDFKDFIKLL